MSISHARYPANPAYGEGVYRRRVRLIGGDRSVTAILNDDFHAMWCRVHHDGAAVTEVEAEMSRIPKTTCPGAALALRELVGTVLDISRSELFGDGRTSRNCTHLLDLALLAFTHCRRGDKEHVIDIAVADEKDAVLRMTGHVDGVLCHDWQVAGSTIQSPIELHGRPLFSGFIRWAEEEYADLALDVARMMQKGAFVSRGRRHVFGLREDMWLRDEPERAGDCFSFSEPQISQGRDTLGYVRDFKNGVVEVLPGFTSPRG